MKKQTLSFNLYEEIVKTLIKEDSSQVLEVKGLEHTAIVLDNLVSTANEKINLFWRTLEQPVWNTERVYTAVEKAINRGVDLKVAVQDTVTVQDTNRRGLSQVRFIFYNHKVPVMPFKPDELQDQNFLSCDGKAFLLWKYSAQRGVACFNDPTLASQLRLDYGSVRKR